MSVSTTFIHCPAGQWTQIAQLRPERNALWISCLEANCILSPSTAGPVITSALGIAPAGYPHQPDGGPVPALTRIDAPNDLVTQQWFAWPIAALPVITTGSVDLSGASPVSIPNPAPTGSVLTVMACVAGGNVAAVMGLDQGGGALTPDRTTHVTDAISGDTMATFWWSFFGGVGPTLTFTYNPVDGPRLAFYAWVPSQATEGAAGGNLVPSGTISFGVLALGPEAGKPVIMYATGVGTTTSGIGSGDWTDVAATFTPLVSTNGGLFVTMLATGYTTLNPVTFTVIPDTGIDGGSFGYVMLFPAGGGGGGGPVTITVSESFTSPALDDPDFVDPTATISVQLPKLSRGAVAALHSLIKRFEVDQPSEEG